jgi:hypothetical protein
VTRRRGIKLPGGEILTDCIEVTRTITKNQNLANVVNRNYYCRDRGDAGSIFLQPSPIGDYRTETRARKFGSQAGGDPASR